MRKPPPSVSCSLMRRRPERPSQDPEDTATSERGAAGRTTYPQHPRDEAPATARRSKSDRMDKTRALGASTAAEKAYITEKIGIWEVEREITTLRDHLLFTRLVDDWREIAEALPFILRFIGELLTLGPHLALTYLSLRIAQAILPAYRMRIAAQTIHIAQQAVDERNLELKVLLAAFGQQVLIAIVSRCLEWSVQQISNGLSYRLRRIFEVHTLKARFKLDLPSLEDENTARELRVITGRGQSDRAWHALQAIVNSGANVIETSTSFMLLLSMLRERRGDRYIACVALLKPILETVVSDTFYTGNYWAKIVDPTARRVENLGSIAHSPRFYKDIIAFSLGDYIIQQFTIASDILNAKQTFHTPFNRVRSPLSPGLLLLRLADELPLFVLALQAIYSPKHVPMSFGNFTLISKTTSEFSRKLVGFVRGRGPTQSLARHAGTIRAIYDAANLPMHILNGTLPYIRDKQNPGMGLELENVSFSYAGHDKPVLENISCAIPSGALVIIVGTNGGGKTTLLKLLTRLYDTSAGDILINGRSIREYQLDSLHNGVAALWQDHQVMPLTAAENIGAGDTDNVLDNEAIRQAAQRAGCLDLIEEMPKKFETHLGAPDLGMGRVRTAGSNRPNFLRKQAKDQEREVKLSGGQMQKLALARVMMRESKADLLLFDEPSASLDARAERDLFLRIHALRGRKTIVWVSHRLHLARHADLVIMLDKGRITEMGPPDTLLQDPTSTFAELYRFQNE